MRRTFILALLVFLVAGGVAFGQAQKGSISVTVVAEDGSPLPGAVIEAASDQTLSRRTGVTDAQGTVDLVALDPAANYVVTTTLEGFNGARNENILVRAGQDTPIQVTLSLATVSEELVVTSESPVVDTTSATTGQEITLQLTESLPTGRSYQDYLQLVPGVLPDDPTNPGNPASRSGINYSDILGRMGRSTDNFYYIEGINVTDALTGTFGANLNTEIIQEQSVITGGVPAEYVGSPGLVSNVITKSGGNQFSGSVNYYFQTDSMVADNKHYENAQFSTYDTAATLGGPILRDRLWFFASWRIVNRQDDVISPEGDFLRSVERDGDQGFGKLTWSATESTLISGTWLSDPLTISGQRDNLISNSLDFSREQGADRYNFSLSHVFRNNLALDAAYSNHSGDLNDFAVIQEQRNEIAFRGDDPRTQAEEALGGEGNNDLDTRSTEGYRGSLEYFVDSSWGAHTVKFGTEFEKNGRFDDRNFTGGAQFVSLSNRYINDNVSCFEMGGGDYSNNEFQCTSTADIGGFIQGVNNSPRRAEIYARLDSNHDGVLTPEEVGNNLIYNSTLGNPHGQINHKRDLQVGSGAREVNSEGSTYYLQDTWQKGRFSVNLGVRAEQWEHFATTGQNIYTFDWDIAPRVSFAYDLAGDGRKRVSAYYGRYYDPIRNNMTGFAGTLTGRVIEEQVFVSLANDGSDGEWVTFRTRGGAETQDAFFASNTKTPYTDEMQLGYKQDMGRNMSLEFNVISRRTRDILEDYDHILYMDRDGTGESQQFRSRDGNYESLCNVPGCSDHPDSLFLGPQHFGFPTFADVLPANFFISTLEGGERNWDGAEVIFRKRFSNHWQAIGSYAYATAKGNSNSDSNADFQGDVLWLDPRAPNQYGTQPGLIKHLFKVAGSYQLDNGLQFGANLKFNSGTHASETFRLFSRNLPVTTEGIDFADVNSGLGPTEWIAPGVVGGLTNDSWAQLDLRVAYVVRAFSRAEIDLFLDVYNVLDDQAAIRNQDLRAGLQGVAFGEGLQFNDPRRFYLGARLRF